MPPDTVATRLLPALAHREEEPQFADDALLLTDPAPPGRHAHRAPAGEVRVERVEDRTELLALEPQWQELAQNAAEPNPFYEPWSLLPALRHFAEPGRVAVYVARDAAGLCGIFPMLRRRGRLEMWRHRYCHLTAPLLRLDRERAAISAWLDALRAQAQVVRMEDVPGDGPVRQHLLDELNHRGWTSLVASAYTRAVLRPARSAEHFLTRALAGKRRKELRRQRSRLSEAGALSVEELPLHTDPRPFIREFLALEAMGWKGASGVAAQARVEDRVYLEEMAVAAAQRGKLQALALRIDGRPVALKLNLMAGNGQGAFAFKITFDEAFARYSPGVQLELENVARAHQLPQLRWMDSCAAPNRFMINHLWPDRREMQTIFFATGSRLGGLLVSLVPLLHFFRRMARPSC